MAWVGLQFEVKSLEWKIVEGGGGGGGGRRGGGGGGKRGGEEKVGLGVSGMGR